MGSNGALLGNVYNSSDGTGKVAETFFKKLAENHSLHQKLETVSWIAEDEYRGLAMLSRTLFLFTMDIRDERDKAVEDSAQTLQELTYLRSILCSACKKNGYQGEKENNVPEQDINIPSINLEIAKTNSDRSQSPAKGPTLDRRQLRDIKISNKEYRRLSRSPKKNSNKTSPKRLFMEYNPRVLNSSSSHFAGREILAPETQPIDVSVIAKEPVHGRTSIPETMAMEEELVPHRETYRNTDFFDNSRDVFEDSSCAEEDPPQYLTDVNKTAINENIEPLTYTHISPVLGRAGSGSKDSPFRGKLHSMHDDFSSSSGSSNFLSVKDLTKNCSNTESAQVSEITNNVQAKNSQAKYLTDINASPITSKIVNITVSPKCQSEVEFQSPSLLNIVPQKKVYSQPIGSQISIPTKSPYKCYSNQSPIALLQPNEIPENSITRDIPTVNLLLPSQSCNDVEVKATDDIQNVNLGTLSCDPQKETIPANIKSTENSKNDKKQELHNKTSTLMREKYVSIPKKIVTNLEHSPSVLETVCAPSINLKKDIVTNRNLSDVTAKSCLPSSRMLGGSSSKTKNRSLSVAGPNTLHTGKKNMPRYQSHTVAVKGSKLYNKIEVHPVAATIKKNYKQTKLTAESFFASKKKGNLDVSEDPFLAVAVAKSLESKELDDRRRLQLHHPALQQLHQQNPQKPSGSAHVSPSRPKRRSNERAPDPKGQTPNKSNRLSTKRVCVGQSSHESELTESQVMRIINTSSTEEAALKECTPEVSEEQDKTVRGTPIKRGARQDKNRGSTPMKYVRCQGKGVGSTPTKCGTVQDKKGNNCSVNENKPGANEEDKKVSEKQLRNEGKEESALGNKSNNMPNNKRRLHCKVKSPTSAKKMKYDLEGTKANCELGAIGLAAANLCRRRQAEIGRQNAEVAFDSAPMDGKKSDDAVHDDMTKRMKSSTSCTTPVRLKGALRKNLSKNRKDKKMVRQDLNDSFDRVPNANNSPNYAHAGPVERNQSKRRQLPGWACKQCKEYYEGRDLTEEQLADHMNRCSKHRSKHQPLVSTPTGYWDPEMTYTDSDS